VRELENLIERAVVLDTDGVVGTDDLPHTVAKGAAATGAITIPVGSTMADAERRLILATLAHAGDDKALAASILGVGRRTIYRKLDEYAADGDGSIGTT
jgi:DNA-binding NtrC family response regulator